MEAYKKLEYLKNNFPIDSDVEKDRGEAMNEKYGVIG